MQTQVFAQLHGRSTKPNTEFILGYQCIGPTISFLNFSQTPTFNSSCRKWSLPCNKVTDTSLQVVTPNIKLLCDAESLLGVCIQQFDRTGDSGGNISGVHGCCDKPNMGLNLLVALSILSAVSIQYMKIPNFFFSSFRYSREGLKSPQVIFCYLPQAGENSLFFALETQ